MQDLLLLMAAAAMFVLGYFVMKKLDHFLENMDHAAALQPRPQENSLRIGFSDPLAADSITDILDAYTKSRRKASIYFLSGTENELLRELSRHRLDMVFLPESIAVPERTHYNVEEVSLGCTPVIATYSGLEIEPVTERQISQKVLWEDQEKASIASDFI